MITTALPRCERAAVWYLILMTLHLMMSQWMQISHPKTSTNINLWKDAQMITVLFGRHKLLSHERQYLIVKTQPWETDSLWILEQLPPFAKPLFPSSIKMGWWRNRGHQSRGLRGGISGIIPIRTLSGIWKALQLLFIYNFKQITWC